MPYKCVHCSAVYKDGSQEVLTGCAECRSKFFFYIKEEKLKEISKNTDFVSMLNPAEKKQIEEDVRDIAGIKDEDTPVFLDFESVKVIKSGTYLLDLPKLFAMNKPRIYQLEDGKYIVDLTHPLSLDN
ncbi:Zn-ribbon domain-containing protein [Candidatus Pacearchaeota archaeon]|nr:Zn-ribbon domain-containing protein [Candidatus Pacearchaeota archaeon]